MLVVGGLLVGMGLWLDHYAPLALGGGRYGVGPTNIVARAKGLDGNRRYVVQHVPGARVRVDVDVRNRGPLPVRITHLVSPGGSGIWWYRLGSPVSIPQHAVRRIVLLARVGTCARFAHDSAIRLLAARLRYSYAGMFKNEQSLDLPTGIELRC